MNKRTTKRINADIDEIKRLIVNQSIYVDMISDILRDARADLADQEQKLSTLVEELAQSIMRQSND